MQLYDHLSQKPYSFDFNKWFSLFDDGSNKMYSWKYKLLSAYQNIHLRNETYDCLQYAIQFKGITVFLHLNIGHILKLPYQKENISKIQLTDIGTSNSEKRIIFFPTENYSYKHLFSSKPIILLQVPTDFGICLAVIDGNHRVTSKKRFHFKNINSLIYMPGHENDFANLFEYTLYNFLIENHRLLL